MRLKLHRMWLARNRSRSSVEKNLRDFQHLVLRLKNIRESDIPNLTSEFIVSLLYVRPVHAGWYVEFIIIISARYVCPPSPSLYISNPFLAGISIDLTTNRPID